MLPQIVWSMKIIKYNIHYIARYIRTCLLALWLLFTLLAIYTQLSPCSSSVTTNGKYSTCIHIQDKYFRHKRSQMLVLNFQACKGTCHLYGSDLIRHRFPGSATVCRNLLLHFHFVFTENIRARFRIQKVPDENWVVVGAADDLEVIKLQAEYPSSVFL